MTISFIAHIHHCCIAHSAINLNSSHFSQQCGRLYPSFLWVCSFSHKWYIPVPESLQHYSFISPYLAYCGMGNCSQKIYSFCYQTLKVVLQDYLWFPHNYWFRTLLLLPRYCLLYVDICKSQQQALSDLKELSFRMLWYAILKYPVLYRILEDTKKIISNVW